MKKDQIKTVTNNQTAQGQVSCSTDTKESMKDFLFNSLYGSKYYPEIERMLSMAVTTDYLDSLDKDNLPKLEDAGPELLQKTVAATIACNEVLAEKGEEPLCIPDNLNAYQIAQLIIAFRHVVLVPKSAAYETYDRIMKENSIFPQIDDYYHSYVGPGGIPRDEYAVLFYNESKDNGQFGHHNYEEECHDDSVWGLCIKADDIGMMNTEVIFWLHIFADKVIPCQGHELMLLENGILNCETKKLMPFSPDYVFLNQYGWVYAEGKEGPVMKFWNSLEMPEEGPVTKCWDTTEMPVDDWLEWVKKDLKEHSMDGITHFCGIVPPKFR